MLIKNKRCPRCNFKVDRDANVCPKCRLNYIKYNSATNKEARVAFSAGESDRVLMRKGCPSDVKRWKLLLITIFSGFFGGHYYYTGRKKWGIFFSAFCLVGLINSLILLVTGSTPKGDLYQIFYLFVLVWGIVIMLWLVDIVKVALNRFKIPVSLPKTK